MKHVAVAVRRYRLELPGYDWFEPQTTTDLARVVRSLRAARLAGLTVRATLLPLQVEQVPACSWCRARPRAVENDCDGSYLTATCVSPQCREARRLAYDGVIAYPSHRRGGQAARLVKPVRIRRADGPPPGVVTVDEYDDITCECGNISSFAGFHPCLPGGALVEPDHPEWNGLYWCAAVGCSGVIVDCRYLDDDQADSGQMESVTDAFPVEIDDQCGDCSAHQDAPPDDHHVACSTRWN
ncbi:hypothetical protein ACGF0J_14310 [Nonomuraea sp. NPDC047897]|uniref:hypothetical protein n=1 Tax=Nonomuraea sp. NPDC047897 TaxID=3364346 RepID=UPI0037248713